jgi:uncharacterized membrane protein (DUF485 family)
VPAERQRGRAASTGAWDFGAEPEPADEQSTVHERVQAGPEFRMLRRRMRGFAFPLSAAFLLWYLVFVLLTSYARDLMATPVLGEVNLGLAIGLGQFATTFALTAGYVRYARRRLDPLAEQIRATVEDGLGRDAGAGQVIRVDRPQTGRSSGLVGLTADVARVGSPR